MLKGMFSLEGIDADADPGTPLGPGGASGPGNTTFSRSYTKAAVSLDCASFTASITFRTAPRST